jgi:hypothetical protein
MKMPVMMSAMPSSWRVLAVGLHAASIFELGVLQDSLEMQGTDRRREPQLFYISNETSRVFA